MFQPSRSLRVAAAAALVVLGAGLATPAARTSAATLPRFATGTVIPVAIKQEVSVLTTADVNGDGIPDLILGIGVLPGDVDVFLGQSGGGYAEQGPINAGVAQVTGLAVGDVTGDGIPDIVVAGFTIDAHQKSHGAITVLRGTGGGGFLSPQQVAAPSQVHIGSPVLGDFYGDHRLSIAVTAQAPNPAGASYVATFRNNGSSGFGQEVDVATTASPLQLAAGDLNGDGIADLVVAGNGVQVLLGHAGTGLGTAVQYASPITPLLVSLAHVTSAVHLDVVVGGKDPGMAVETYPGAGDGTLGTPVVSQVGPATTQSLPVGMVLGDLNGDGVPDMAMVNAGVSAITILRGARTGGFTVVQTAPAGVENSANSIPTTPLAITDVDHDGHPDVIYALTNGDLAWLSGRGDGTVRAAAATNTAETVTFMAAADFNGDGRADLAVVTGGSIDTRGSLVIELSNGDGTFTAAGTYSDAATLDQVAVGDFAHNGRPEIALVEHSSTDRSLDRLVILPVDTSGHIGAPTATYLTRPTLGPGSAPSAIVAGDVDGDGLLDLAVLVQGQLQLFLGNAGGSFSSALVPPAAGGSHITMADLEHLGRMDVITSDTTDTVDVYPATGVRAAPLGTPVTSGAPLGIDSSPLATGDVTGDGRPDVVASMTGYEGIGGGPVVLVGTGTPVLVPATSPTPPTQVVPWAAILVADLGGTGKASVVPLLGDEMPILQSDGTGNLSQSGPLYDGVDVGIAGVVADVNGDGRPDIVLAPSSGGLVTLLQY